MAKTWTAEEDELLRAAVIRGTQGKDIRINGKSYSAIQTRMTRLGIYTDRFVSKQKDTFALRRCMTCERTFGSQHVGNRICPACKESPEYRAA